MEYCPYCQRWVEPKKGTSDLVLGGAVDGLRGLAVGAAHYFYKGSRCPICNNIIKGLGTHLGTKLVKTEKNRGPNSP